MLKNINSWTGTVRWLLTDGGGNHVRDYSHVPTVMGSLVLRLLTLLARAIVLLEILVFVLAARLFVLLVEPAFTFLGLGPFHLFQCW